MKQARFFLLLLLLVGVAVYFSRGRFFKEADQEEKNTALPQQHGPDLNTEQVQSFSIFGFSEDGKKAWEVEGKSADILSDIINLSDIDANSYGDKVTVNLTADEGVLDRSSNTHRQKLALPVNPVRGIGRRSDKSRSPYRAFSSRRATARPLLFPPGEALPCDAGCGRVWSMRASPRLFRASS